MNTTVNTEVVDLLQSYRKNSKFLYNRKSWLTENEVWDLLKENEAEILSQFGLPNERRYFKLLRAFGQTKNNDVVSRNIMLKQLEQKAHNFLLRPVLPMAQRLELAKRNDESPLDILPEIGFTTHHFNIFLYSNLFLNNQATADEIVNDLCLARDNKELPYIFNLALIPDYKNEPEYIFFKQSGFKFIDAYCKQTSFIPEPLSTQYEKIEEHTYRNFEVNNLELNNIVFDSKTGPTIFCTYEKFGKSKDIQIGLEFEQLYELLKSCECKGETLVNLITKKLNEKDGETFAVIDLDDFTGPLSLQHCNLSIYRALQKTKDGKYEEYSSNFFMLEELKCNSNSSSATL